MGQNPPPARRARAPGRARGGNVVTQQTSGAFFYYTDFPLVRWDTLKPERFARLAAAVGPRPLFAVLFPHEVTDALKLNSTGLWTQIGAVRQVTIWRWAPTAP